jgi:hypothetical protein
MKGLIVLNAVATVTTIACVAMAIMDKDWSEAAAWSIVVLYNVQNLIYNLLNNN